MTTRKLCKLEIRKDTPTVRLEHTSALLQYIQLKHTGCFTNSAMNNH